MPKKLEVIRLYKKCAETPLECIKRFFTDHPGYSAKEISYLGRSDPTVEGLLLVLIGRVRDKGRYLVMDKTYQFEVLWGFATDTYDVLGKVLSKTKAPQKLEEKMASLTKYLLGKRIQSYPPRTSSTTVGSSLFLWANEHHIAEVNAPARGIKIFSIRHIHTRLVSDQEILNNISTRIPLIKTHLHRKEIMKSWRKALVEKPEEKFLCSKFETDVSSGVYIGSLAHEMGKRFGTSALAYSIKRLRNGEYRLA